ncbi:unnamed protein product [Wuchereria bancrofti]|uniref:Uncharacterized protein n=1 Tax=Wuchereria bancrofti TaxID=6293 RepID=A0A3P7EKF9_WUCBA|nr:unnamed protein product [Wuchereria bancrofti]
MCNFVFFYYKITAPMEDEIQVVFEYLKREPDMYRVLQRFVSETVQNYDRKKKITAPMEDEIQVVFEYLKREPDMYRVLQRFVSETVQFERSLITRLEEAERRLEEMEGPNAHEEMEEEPVPQEPAFNEEEAEWAPLPESESGDEADNWPSGAEQFETLKGWRIHASRMHKQDGFCARCGHNLLLPPGFTAEQRIAAMELHALDWCPRACPAVISERQNEEKFE